MGKCPTAKRQQIWDSNSDPSEAKVSLSTMPCASRLGPGWEQSTEYPYPGPHQASSCAALLPCGTTIYQLQAWAPSSKSEEQSASCTLACTVIDGETQYHCGWVDSWGKACRQHHPHDDLISVNRAWLLTQPQWEWA